MEKRWTKIILVLTLGLILPGILLGAIVDAQNQVTPEITAPTQTQPDAEDLLVNVVVDGAAVRQMQMDDYLVCVLLTEMPADFELEALKAQAVVARTYALRRMEAADKHGSGAVCTESSCCQGYCEIDTYLSSGGTLEDVEKMRRAVESTKDQVLTYNGTLIEATYFSCSGGKTEDAKAVWGADVPYLQAVDSPGEEAASHFMESIVFTKDEFSERLHCSLPETSSDWIKGIEYTAGGGVKTIQIGDNTFTGTSIRTLLGLPSTAFMITAVGDHIIITTKGFGHRVGMSQYGADAMAVNGSTYDEILSHYYRGTELSYI